MVRTLKLYARFLARLVLLTANRPQPTLETEDGQVRSLSRAAVETVRRLVGRKLGGVMSPEDGGAGQLLMSAVETGGNVGDIFEVTIGRRVWLFLVEDAGLAFASFGA